MEIKEFFNFDISHFIVQISGLLTYGQNYIGLQEFLEFSNFAIVG